MNLPTESMTSIAPSGYLGTQDGSSSATSSVSSSSDQQSSFPVKTRKQWDLPKKGQQAKFRYVSSRIDTSWSKKQTSKGPCEGLSEESTSVSGQPVDTCNTKERPTPTAKDPYEHEEKEIIFKPLEFNSDDFASRIERADERLPTMITRDFAPARDKKIIDFQEPQSLVRGYIEGKTGHSKPSVFRQRTSDGIELAKEEYKAQPLLSACEKGSVPIIPVKQTTASRKRLEKLHEENQIRLQQLERDSMQYMTPLQRKDVQIKELSRQLNEAYYVIKQREVELDVLSYNMDRDLEDQIRGKETKTRELNQTLDRLRNEADNLRLKRSDMLKKVDKMEDAIKQFKVQQEDKQRCHEEMYLEMYQKGRNSVSFEEEDEREHLSIVETSTIPIDQLLRKLAAAQNELEYWQMLKTETREDSVEAEAASTIKFLKDSMYHYLLENRKDAQSQHLNAMIGICGFPEGQNKQIKKSLEERRKKGRL